MSLSNTLNRDVLLWNQAIKLPYREINLMYSTCVEVVIWSNVSVLLKANIFVSLSASSVFVYLFQSVGKGSLWCVCPEYRPALLEMLKKTHSYHSTNSNLINKPPLWVQSHSLSACTREATNNCSLFNFNSNFKVCLSSWLIDHYTVLNK